MFFEIFVTLSILQATSCCRHKSNRPPTVTTPLGKIQGTHIESAFLKRKVAAFYGIPYAKPPVGELRFKEPERADAWAGTLIANKPAPQCFQMDVLDPNKNLTAGSEDCLYLNIFTPKINSELMEVIFYIHGGGFVILSANYFGFERLMDEDVVVVAISYRLGPLGFLSTEDEVVPGNNGLKDQNLALKWVKRNIRFFGGDPNKITITGFSAGAASVHYHLVSPMSKGLFRSAILESGAAFNPWAHKKNPRRRAEKLARSLRCPADDSKAMVDCLRKRPASELVYDADFDGFNLYTDFYFVPSIEPPNPKAFLTKTVESIMLKGEAVDVPLLMSFTKDEGLLFTRKLVADSALYDKLEKNWTQEITKLISYHYPNWLKYQDEITTALRQHYIGYKRTKENYFKGVVKMISDWAFIGGIEEAAKIFGRVNKSPVYVFLFNYTGKIKPISQPIPGYTFEVIGHTEQSQYIAPFFGNRIPNDEPMASPMLNTWMSFIKGRGFNRKWKPVKQVLPKFGFLDVRSPKWYENDFKVFDDFTSRQFWESISAPALVKPLGFKE